MIQKDTKTARIDARLPEAVHAVLQRAAALQGRSLSDFVVSSAREAAERTIAEHDVLQLSIEDQSKFAEALLASESPAASLKKAAARHAKLVEEA